MLLEETVRHRTDEWPHIESSYIFYIFIRILYTCLERPGLDTYKEIKYIPKFQLSHFPANNNTQLRQLIGCHLAILPHNQQKLIPASGEWNKRPCLAEGSNHQPTNPPNCKRSWYLKNNIVLLLFCLMSSYRLHIMAFHCGGSVEDGPDDLRNLKLEIQWLIGTNN